MLAVVTPNAPSFLFSQLLPCFLGLVSLRRPLRHILFPKGRRLPIRMHNVCQGAHIVPCRVSAVHARAVYVQCACLMLACASTANSAADLGRIVACEAEAFPVVAREAGARFTRFFMAPCGGCLAARAPFGLARRACCCRFLFVRNACFFSVQSSSSPSSVDALWAHAAHTFFLPVQAGVRVEVTRRTRNYTSRHAVR